MSEADWLDEIVALRRAGADRPLKIAGIHAVLLTAAQVMLGVFTVVSLVALPLAALHQLCALALFGAALWWAYTLNANAARSI